MDVKSVPLDKLTVRVKRKSVEHEKSQTPETPFERFKRITAQIVSVPRAEIQKRELQWKNGRKQHKSHKRHR